MEVDIEFEGSNYLDKKSKFEKLAYVLSNLGRGLNSSGNGCHIIEGEI